MLQTVQKIGPLLDLFTPDRPEWGVSEAAEALGVPRSSAHALMTSLVEIGLLSTTGRGRYRLGWRIIELYQVLQSGLDLREAAAPILARLNEETGETVNLAVLDRGNVLYLDKVAARQQVSVQGLRVGTRLEPHATALGKALLAALTPADAAKLLGPGPLRKYTQNTVTDPNVLLAQLEDVRRTGLATEENELVLDVSCVASPIRDSYGSIVAAISVSVPSHRLRARRKEITQAVRSAANEISQRVAEASER